jgi:hypothetical protein
VPNDESFAEPEETPAKEPIVTQIELEGSEAQLVTENSAISLKEREELVNDLPEILIQKKRKQKVGLGLRTLRLFPSELKE